jgi:hypothetical protein
MQKRKLVAALKKVVAVETTMSPMDKGFVNYVKLKAHDDVNKAVKELESKKGLQQIPKLLKIFEVEDISDLARKILSLKYQTDF